MNLIVFDLEWNIGYQPKTFLYHGTELTLRGEIIQIGAARINDRGDVLDTFEVNLKPHIFRKLQHHIAKVTGLSQGDLDAGLPMKEGLQKFLDWAGDDAELERLHPDQIFDRLYQSKFGDENQSGTPPEISAAFAELLLSTPEVQA